MPEVRREEAVRLERLVTVQVAVCYRDGESDDPLEMERTIVSAMSRDGWTARVVSIRKSAGGGWEARVRQEREVAWRGKK